MKRFPEVPTLLITSLLILFFNFAFAAMTPEQEVAAIQQKIAEQGLHWEAGLNPVMTNYTPEQRQQMLGLKLPANWEEVWRAHLKKDFLAKAAADLPTTFNWADSGKMTAVKDQGGCGSCWIFCATGALEGMYKIYRQQELDLSEQQMLSCVSPGWGCDGGWMDDVYAHQRSFGQILEANMPYQANDDVPCTESQYTPAVVIEGWTAIPNNVNAIKTAVMKGPVGVAFYVFNDFFGYRSGCYSNPQFTTDANHAVVVVGWDDNMCGGMGAWRVKNSWGPSWGEHGYFWIQYGTCNFGLGAVLLDIDAVSIAGDQKMPNGDLCQDYDFQMTASGGTPPYSWSVMVAQLPQGLTMDTQGHIQGHPEQPGPTAFAIKVSDASVPPKTFFRYFSLMINDAMNGDANCDGRLNILDVTRLVRYMYMDDPPLISAKAGDVDCSQGCNVLDITYLIQYLYRNGSAPCVY